MKKILILALLIFAVTGLYRLADNTHQAEEWDKSSTSSTMANLDYPDDFTRFSDHTDFMIGYPADDFTAVSASSTAPNAYAGYIPACGTTGFAACVFYTGDDYNDTNFGAAGVAIKQLLEISTASACESSQGNFSVVENERTKGIYDREFFAFSTSQAAMSHRSDDEVYRIYANDECWQLTARIGSTVYEVYEAGAIDRFTDTDQEELRDRLTSIVETFAFKQDFSLTDNNMTATIKTSAGDIEIAFFTDSAPKTVENFTDLAKDDFYQGIIFHRVIEDFMIQGGDPTGTGRGGPGYTFADELDPSSEAAARGYTRGTLAMANSGPDTNGSQFFIMHQDQELPYNYTIFGYVTEGMDVVDEIATTETNANDKPLSDITIEDIIIAE